MPPPKRGYQGKRYRLEDLQNESVVFLTTDQVQVAFMRLENLENGELPERCKTCRWRQKVDDVQIDKSMLTITKGITK